MINAKKMVKYDVGMCRKRENTCFFVKKLMNLLYNC